MVGAGYIGVELAEALESNGRGSGTDRYCGDLSGGYYDERNFPIRWRDNLKDTGVTLAFGEDCEKAGRFRSRAEGNLNEEATIPTC